MNPPIPFDAGSRLSPLKASSSLSAAFASAWEAGQTPSLEAFLEQAPPADRGRLLRELLGIEVLQRRARGEQPDPTAYARRFPEWTEAVTDAFTPFPTSTVSSPGMSDDTAAPADSRDLPLPVGDAPSSCTMSVASKVHPSATDSWTVEPGVHEPAETVDFRPSDIGTPSTLAGRKMPGGGDFGDYELLDEIARGGMGVVYRARQRKLNRVVAVKMITAGQLASDEAVARFYAEARAAAHLDHRHIVPIYEIGERDGQHFFSMALVEGGSLQDRVKSGPLPPEQAARLVATVADAVQYAHDRQILHRDLKPHNILLDDQGEPKIADFGLAKQLQSDNALTATGDIMGTPSYMAPEQAAGLVHDLGPTVDVYALGAILYCLLAGRPPFQTASVVETLRQVQEQEPVGPRLLDPAVPRDLETICLKCLEKQSSRRYATAHELAADLRRFLADEPIMARRVNRLERAVRWCRRRPVAAGLLAAVVMALLAAGMAVHLGQEARRSQKLIHVRQALQTKLDQPALTENYLADAEAIVAALASLQPADGRAARHRLHAKFLETIQTSLRRYPLEPQDVDEIRQAIAVLASRDKTLAEQADASLSKRLSQWLPVFDLQPPQGNIAAVFARGVTADTSGGLSVELPLRTRQLKLPRSDTVQFDDQVVPTLVSCTGTDQLEAVFDAAWPQAERLGLLLSMMDDDRSYAFLLRAQSRRAQEDELLAESADVAEDTAEAAAKPEVPGTAESAAKSTLARKSRRPNFAAIRRAGGLVSVEILKDDLPLQRVTIPIEQLGEGPLTLRAIRQRDRLTFQINQLKPLEFQDAFARTGQDQGRFAVDWPRGVNLLRLQAQRRVLPPEPNPLQQADDFYHAGRYDEALAIYRAQELAEDGDEVEQETRYKGALCLLALGRQSEAQSALEQLMPLPGERWPPLAGCQLWLLLLGQQRDQEASAVHDYLANRFRHEQLAALIPGDVRAEILEAYFSEFESVASLLRYDPQRTTRLERAAAVDRLLSPTGRGDPYNQFQVCRAYRYQGRLDEALTIAEKIANDFPGFELAAWHRLRLLRLTGRPEESLPIIDKLIREFDPGETVSSSYLRLYLERARVHVALDDTAAAISNVEAFFKMLATTDSSKPEWELSSAHLIRGFLEADLGDEEAAQRIWREGFQATRERLQHTHFSATALGLNTLIMGSLTDQLRQADSDRFIAALGQGSDDRHLFSFVASFATPATIHAVLSDMWRSPRGRVLARQFAFEEFDLGPRVKIPAVLAAHEYLRQNAFAGSLFGEREQVVWEIAEEVFAAILETGQLSMPQVVQLGLTWKGTTSFLGWSGVAPSLPRKLRAQFAFVFAHRYLRLGNQPQALDLFRTAQTDAASHSDLVRAAELDLELAQRQSGRIRFTTHYPDPVTIVIRQGDKPIASVEVNKEAEITLPAGDYELSLDSARETITLSASTVTLAVASRAEIQLGWQWERSLRRNPLPGVVPYPADLPDIGRWQIVRKPLEAKGTVCWSPDGERVALGGGDGLIRLYDARTLHLQQILCGHRGKVAAVDWNRDGRRLASADTRGEMLIWDTDQARLERRIAAFDSGLTRVAWDPGGGRLAAASIGGMVSIWSDDGQRLRSWVSKQGRISDLVWSPDGHWLCFASHDSVMLCDTPQEAEPRRLPDALGSDLSLAWTADGRRLAACSLDAILVWHADDWTLARRWELPEKKATEIVWETDGQHLWSTPIWSDSSLGKNFWRWDVEAASDEPTIVTVNARGHGAPRFAPGSDTTFLLRNDNGLARVDMQQDQVTAQSTGRFPRQRIQALSWHPDGTCCAVVREEPRLHVLDTSGQTRALLPLGERGRHGGWSPDGQWLAVASDSVLSLWQGGRQPAITIETTLRGEQMLAWHPNSHLLATGGADRRVRVWSTSGELVDTFEASHPVVTALAWSRDGKHLAVGAAATGIDVFDDSGQRTWSTRLAPTQVSSLAWKPDENWLAAGLSNGLMLTTLDGPAKQPENLPGRVMGVAWSQAIHAWIAVTDQGFLYVVDQDARIQHTTDLGASSPLALSVHPSEPLASIGQENGTLLTIDLTTGQTVRVTLFYGDRCVTLSPAGKFLTDAVDFDAEFAYLVETADGRQVLLSQHEFDERAAINSSNCRAADSAKAASLMWQSSSITGTLPQF